MIPIVWLGLALVVGIGSYLVGRPAWRSRRDRISRDTNTERYLAWRGRAREATPDAGTWTSEERVRLLVAGALGVASVVALIGFFVTS
jgi:hypothetical protein